MNVRCVVLDANIAFKALAAGRGDLRERLGRTGQIEYFTPRFLFVELDTELKAGLRARGFDRFFEP